MNQHTVNCIKLKKALPGLKRPPLLPGDLGQKVYENVSQQAWDDWKKRQVMFINEYQLNVSEAAAKQFLLDQMQAYLFEDDDRKPSGYSAPRIAGS